MSGIASVDVHQHLWPAPLLDALRARRTPPMLRGWTLHTAAEPPFAVAAGDHDPVPRAAREVPTSRVLVSVSTPLGIEYLPAPDAQPLLDAWHCGAAELPQPFRAWAAVGAIDPDLDGLDRLCRAGFVGLQVPAAMLASPAAIEAAAPLLRRCEQLNWPVFVHPGPVCGADGAEPAWWPAVVAYSAQLHAAWWAWQTAGRSLLPDLRLCFAAGAGLAPLHHERFAARSGHRFVVDRDTFVDTSSHGPQAIDALTRALGIDVIVLGTDRPYAEPADLHLGEAATHAISVTNPHRLLEGALP
ncbi:MAG: amidohydrolase family protein [Jatrophihabitantaceae bacterium]